jgi:uncharacterized membrane protein YphA (DoxX/SURF4 family)
MPRLIGVTMHPHILAAFCSILLPAFFEISRTAISMSAAGVLLVLVGGLAAGGAVRKARGLDKIVALSNICFAAPLAVFGAEHLSAAQGIMQGVPKYMPWPLFWAYFVGFALVAASLSIATGIQVRWSGLLFGIMMMLFVAMIHIPGALASHGDRIRWTIVFREMSFAGGSWALAGSAMIIRRSEGKNWLITVGRVLIGVGAIFFSIQHFLHPANVPGVPLEKLIPAWIPGRAIVGYFTGAILLVGGVCILLNRRTRVAATCLGTWIFALVLLIYGPILVVSLLDPSTAVKVEGLNYFFDTLLYAGAILALARAMPQNVTPQNAAPRES